MIPRLLVLSAVLILSLVEATADEDIRVIPRDAPPTTPFFSGPVPRFSAIADDAALHDVAVVGNNCWAVGQRGLIVRSADGGQSWQTSVLPFECSLQSVDFLTNQIGFVAGFQIDAASGQTRAVLLTTRDGGDTWRSFAPAPPERFLPGLRYVNFFDLEHGVVLTMPEPGQPSSLRTTADRGTTWNVLPHDSNAEWLDAAFTSPAAGILVGARMSWGSVVGDRVITLSPPQPTLQAARAVSITDDGGAWIVGDGGLLMQSSSRGISWAPPPGRLPDQLRDVCCLEAVVHDGPRVCAAGGPAATVLRSENYGNTWTLHPSGQSGSIRRLRHVDDDVLIALGSWGTILRSPDFGVSWTAVRGGNRRAALLYLVTDPRDSASGMLASVAGDRGYRTVIAQPSCDQLATRDTSLRDTAALSQLAVGHLSRDWRFARRRRDQELSQSSLLRSWNSQSDGRLRDLLPIRLATQIRMWQPDIVCIEAKHERDAVAGIWRSAVFTAASIAAGEDRRSAVLDQFGLPPWTVKRILRREPNARSTLTYSDDDLLPALQTTAGLISEHWKLTQGDGELISTDASYVVHSTAIEPTPTAMFQGIALAPGSAARRSLPPKPDNTNQLRATVQKHRVRRAAVTGSLARDPLSEALIAETQTLGSDLPPALAAEQLLHLTELYRSRENLEGLISALQEIVRRSPGSAHGARAVEELHWLYSSKELRGLRSLRDRNAESRNLQSNDGERPMGIFIGRPDIRQVSGTQLDLLRPSAGASRENRDRRWNEHATTAWKILQSSAPDRAALAKNLLIRAAHIRQTGDFGEDRMLLTEASGAPGKQSILARAELQAVFASAEAPVAVFNLPKSSGRPILDGMLSDKCWQDAPEIRLTDALSSEDVPDSLIMIAWDEEFVFLGGRCAHVRGISPQQEALDRDHDEADTHGDHVDFLFDIDRDYSTGFRFIIDSAGRTNEKCGPFNRWDPQWFVATERDDTSWRFEAAIPVEQLMTEPLKPGQLWATTISRNIPGHVDQTVATNGVPDPSGTRYSLLRFIRNRR